MAESSERGAKIVALAMELMRTGKARGWSHAIELARQAVAAQKG
jgi:hypothetical protein